ncbi:glycosyltransferase family 4 protein [Candidatus Gottesmanbacteria bacterium]|nr:glycosyltransferase family 4 protein [Candidatus Gottesmanbacteria bacterium]
MKKPKIALVRGKFLNTYEMQMYEPLVGRYDITAFGSLTSYHDRFVFPAVKLPSPMDLPEFPYNMSILNRLFVDAHYLWGLEEKLTDYDIVHTAETYFHYTQQCLNVRREGRVKKVVATVLENIPFNNEGIWGRKRFKARARRELDHIVALTHKTKETLLAEGADPKKITVIGHFIDTKRFKPDPTQQRRLADRKRRKFRILFAGRLEEYKGVYDVVQAVWMLVGDIELAMYQLTLVMVGDGSEQEKLKRIVREYGLGDRVDFQQASYEQMPEVYRQADIFVAPSKPRIRWEEQYCTVLLEAQASGLPIVTTATGGIPENIKDAGVVVTPGDVQAIARGIKAYILDPKLRISYAKKARARALGVHDITIGAKKLDELYQMLLSASYVV